MEAFTTRKVVKTLSLILVWYVLSTGLSLYNKQLVGKDHGLGGKGAFPAPLLMSSVQFACQTVLAKLVFFLGLSQRTNNRRMPWSDYLRMVVPNGVTTGLDIGFSNKSLVFINLAFYTMCKSTVPVFLLFFAFVWGIEKPNLELFGVVLVIVAGLALLVWGETKFDLLGFGLVMTASCLSGLRFTLTQVLLHGHQASAALGGPLEVLELLTPVMSVTVLLFSIAWEELWDVLPGSPYFDGLEETLLTLLVVAVGALIAFLMVWAEYQVIKETSALTFMIAGTVKEVVTVMAAVLVMGDELTAVNGMGLVIVIMGVLLFNLYKYRKIRNMPAVPRKKLKQQAPPESSMGAGGYTVLDMTAKGDDLGLGSGGNSPETDSSKHRRHGRGSGATPSPPGSATASVAAAAAAAAANGAGGFDSAGGPGSGSAVGGAGASGPGGGSSSSLPSSHHAATGLLGRAIASVLARTTGAGGGGSGSAASLELTPLLSSSGSAAHEGGAGGGGGGRLPTVGSAAAIGSSGSSSGPLLDRDRGADVAGLVVGLGSSGDDPAAALALSGAGISGPPRGQRSSRGLTPDDQVPLLGLGLPAGLGAAPLR